MNQVLGKHAVIQTQRLNDRAVSHTKIIGSNWREYQEMLTLIELQGTRDCYTRLFTSNPHAMELLRYQGLQLPLVWRKGECSDCMDLAIHLPSYQPGGG